MNIVYLAYNVVSSSLFLLLFPLFCLYAIITGRHLESIKQRLGLYPRRPASAAAGPRRLWIHAASVGEVRVAFALIDSLSSRLPDMDLILSTVTEQGHRVARSGLGSKALCVYAPLDFFVPVALAFARVKPDMLVCLETEIWPNLLLVARQKGVKTALVNGRISERSIKRYLAIRPFMREVLKSFDAFSMIREADAHRIHRVGAPADRIAVNGNAKYDLLLRDSDPEATTAMKRLYDIGEEQPVFVAGSTREKEEEIILDVYGKIIQAFPETLLIIAPRHVNRAGRIEALVRERKLSVQLRTGLESESRRRSARVIILDTIGELQKTYSIATIVFCGGSLVPLGGQNVLEAAVWGKPVFYGPSMEDFQDAREMLEKTGGGIQVANGYDLAQKALGLLADPQEAERIGRYARQAVLAHKGAAHQHAAVIHRLLAGD